MEFIKTIGACAMVAAVVSGVLASASLASANEPEGFGPLAGSPFSDAASTMAKEIAVLTGRGISRARAEQALDVQGKVARAALVRNVEAAMGSAYAGVWFEPAAAQVHIGVTSEASRRAAQRAVANAGLAAVVTYTPVRSTWSALIAAQNRWNKRLAKLLASHEAMTGLDPQRNAVSVTLSASISLQERGVLERAAATASVNVLVEIASPSQLGSEPAATCKFKRLEAYCEKTLVSGVGIAPAGVTPECSAGPMLIEGNETYMLTAGHCFAANEDEEGLVEGKVTSAYPEAGEPIQKEIGKEGKWMYTKARDMAIVKISAASAFRAALPTPVPALMAEWGKKTESPQAVIGEAANMVGETNCHEGMTSGEQCGSIETVDMTIDGYEHLVEDSACAEGGDSGGPFFFSNSTVNNVTMQGMLVRRSIVANCSKSEGKSWYEPLKDEGAVGFGILSTFNGKQLLTTASEVRARPAGPVFSFCHKTGEVGATFKTIACSPSQQGAQEYASAYADTAHGLLLCLQQTTATFQYTNLFCNLLSAGDDTGSSELVVKSGAGFGTPTILGVPLDTATLKSSVAGNIAVISCTKGTFSIQPEESGKLSEGKLEYTGCTAPKPAGCSVKEPIEGGFTGQLLATDKVLLMGAKETATAKEIFAEIEYTGSSCVVKGVQFPLHGQQICEGLSGISTLKLLQTLECTAADSSLKLGAENATFENKISLDATSKEYWAILSVTA